MLLRAGLVVFPGAIAAHAQAPSRPSAIERQAEPDIVVTGEVSGGSAIRDAAPVAVFDEDMIRALGVTSAGGHLIGLARSAHLLAEPRP